MGSLLRLHGPSGRFSGPTLKPRRGFLDWDAEDAAPSASSRVLFLGAMAGICAGFQVT